MEEFNYKTKEEFLQITREIINRPFSDIEKYNPFNFSLLIDNIWYNLTYSYESGTTFIKGKILMIKYGRNNELLNSVKNLTVVQKDRKLQSCNHKLYYEQFGNDSEVEFLFRELEKLHSNHFIDKEKWNKDLVANLVEFNSKINRMEKLSSNSILFVVEDTSYFITKTDNYHNNNYKFELDIIKNKGANFEVVFKTQDKKEIDTLFNFVEFATYFFNAKKDSFIKNKRIVEKILTAI